MVPGHHLAGVLRAAHAGRRRRRCARAIQAAERVVVVGAGFLGLEAAAVAAARGAQVDVVEATMLPMGRAVSAIVSEAFARQHRRQGHAPASGCRGGRHCTARDGRGEREVELADGTQAARPRIVLVCIGVIPNTELAADAGLAVDNGDRGRCAAGDRGPGDLGHRGIAPPTRTALPAAGLRLESVQNAVDHARCLAERLLGKPVPYHAVPWFWSDQGDWKLQIAGFTAGCQALVPRGDPDGRDFTVYAFRDGRLAGVETVNRPAEHVAARRLLATGSGVTPDMVADPAFDVRRAARAAQSAGHAV